MKKTFFALAAVGIVAVAVPMLTFAEGSVVGSVDNDYQFPMYLTTNGRTIISGWAINRDVSHGSTTIVVKSPTLGGQAVDQFNTNFSRPDVARAYGTTSGGEGFNWVVPARFYTGGTYEFDFYAMNAGGSLYKIGSRRVNLTDRGLRGSVDSMSGKNVIGWATDLDGDNPRAQKTSVYVTIDGQQVGMALTEHSRPDVVNYWAQSDYSAVSPNAGYNVALDIPHAFRDGKVHTIHVFALEFTEGTVQQIGTTQYRTIDVNGLIQ